MIVVLDSNAAVEIVLNRSLGVKLAEVVENATAVFAPDFFVSEVVNAFWKYSAFEDLPPLACEQGAQMAIGIIDKLMPSSELAVEALSLACRVKHPAYDCFFLVLARRNNALFLTLDKKLKKIAKSEGIRVEY